MSCIKVDHSRLDKSADSIETYIELMKNKMNGANREVSGLNAKWQGTDSNEFKNKWDTVSNNDSTYNQMLKSLKSYAEFLKFSAGKYKEAQSKAVNRANRLPKY